MPSSPSIKRKIQSELDDTSETDDTLHKKVRWGRDSEREGHSADTEETPEDTEFSEKVTPFLVYMIEYS